MAFLLGMTMFLVSCQEEEPLEESIDQELTLTMENDVVSLLKNMVANDGSYDNIIDGASCFDVNFPYEIRIGEEKITVNSYEDLKTVEEALDLLEDKVFVRQLIFPVTLTMADYTQLTIEDGDELKSLAEQCLEGGADEDLECVDIAYPLTLFTYNPNFQLTNTFEVNADVEFRRFIAGLTENDLLSIEFPIQLHYADSTSISVNSNSELANAIEQGRGLCDEDDDIDHNDDDFTQAHLEELLLICPWAVSRYTTSNSEATQYVESHHFTFLQDGKVLTQAAYGYEIEGEWAVEMIEGRAQLSVYFEDKSDYNGAWWVYEIIPGKIRLKNVEEENKLTLEKDCEYRPDTCSEEQIMQGLSDCKWTILNENNTFFEELALNFTTEGGLYVENANGTVVDEGSWSVTGNVVVISQLSKTLANYIGEWKVLECGLDSYKLSRGEEIIVLHKNCEE